MTAVVPAHTVARLPRVTAALVTAKQQADKKNKSHSLLLVNGEK
jgi:hypothetical protein